MKIRDTYFKEVEFKNGVEFNSNNLNDVSIIKTSLKDINLSNNKLGKLTFSKIEKNELDGVVVSTHQALELLSLFGIKVKD